ncbi:MAG TPA: DUF4384 domain-containing protein [Gemmatimonadaceae bacterium]|nr:DUF4384 domain-containing protein [Gemmatimonadaceae bacterium]
MPDIQLWVNGNNFYHRGERARVYFRTDDDAFVLVMRIDTDGRTRVLFPESPLDDNFVRGGATYRVPGYGRESFYVDDYPGMGYVFAVASWRKLDLTAIGDGRRWDYQMIGDRVSRDPFAVMHDIAARLTGNRQDEYALDFTEYHVDRREDYPRFLCYDCHAFRAYSIWNPYAHRCANFRIVIYDDPFYYPYRYYHGTRVVYLRHQRRWPRFELLERRRGGKGPYVEKKRRSEPGVPIRSTPITSDLSRRALPPSVVDRPGSGIPGGEDARVIRPRRTPPVVQTPGRAEPERSEPERSEPRRVDPRRVEPRGPRVREPQRTEPDRIEPRRVEPREREPQRTEPDRVEPRRVEPREQPPEQPREQPRVQPREQPRAQPREAPPPRRDVPSDRRVDPRRSDPR